MKKIYLIHCLDGISNDSCDPCLSNQLDSNNIGVIRFDMPRWWCIWITRNIRFKQQYVKL